MMKFETTTGATNWLHEQFSGSSCGVGFCEFICYLGIKGKKQLFFHFICWGILQNVDCYIVLWLWLETKNVLSG